MSVVFKMVLYLQSLGRAPSSYWWASLPVGTASATLVALVIDQPEVKSGRLKLEYSGVDTVNIEKIV